MLLTSPALLAPLSEWAAWRARLDELPSDDATVAFARRRADQVIQLLAKADAIRTELLAKAAVAQTLADPCPVCDELGHIELVSSPASEQLIKGHGYRLLEKGERVQATDEALLDDGESWEPVGWLYSKCNWHPNVFQPMRRKLDPVMHVRFVCGACHETFSTPELPDVLAELGGR